MRNFVRIVGKVQRYKELKIGTTTIGKLTIRRPGRKNKDGTFGDSMFFDCDIWGLSPQISANLNKWIGNNYVQVVGRLEQQHWGKDGQKKAKIIIKCDAKDIALFPKEQNNYENNQQTDKTPKQEIKKEYVKPSEVDNSDIPF